MAWVFFDKFKKGQLDGSTTGLPSNLSSDTLRLMLLTASYTPDKVNNQFRSDIVANEISGTNYTSRGFPVASIAFSLASDIVTVTAADITVAQSGTGFSNARLAVIYKDSGTNTTSPLIMFYDVGSSFGNTTTALVLQINANNLFTLT